MYDWIIKEEENVTEINLEEVSCSLITTRVIEEHVVTPGKRKILGIPKDKMIIRGFDNGIYTEIEITGDIKLEVKHFGRQNTLDDIPSYFNYEG